MMCFGQPVITACMFVAVFPKAFAFYQKEHTGTGHQYMLLSFLLTAILDTQVSVQGSIVPVRPMAPQNSLAHKAYTEATSIWDHILYNQ